MPVIEKSGHTLYAQRQLAECRKARNRDCARWWMRVAASYRKRDVIDAKLFCSDADDVWWERLPTKYVNG